MVGAVCLTFWPVTDYGFLNWDDPAALAHNPELDGADVARWAFTTRHLSHYQPLSWLVWRGLRVAFGASAQVHHTSSVLGHALNAALAFLLGRRLFGLAGFGGRSRAGAAGVAALLFANHPLRVEVVAWASAFPYVLALAFLLLSVLFHLRDDAAAGGRTLSLALALVTYAASLLSRPLALGFPAVLLALDLALRRPLQRSLLEKVPFALLALAGGVLEWSARSFASLDRVSLGPRLSAAASAPFVYLFRAVVPLGLSPLDVLPLDPRVSWPRLLAGGLLLGLGVLAAWRYYARHPWLVAGAFAYLTLLAPALGLAPSGLQRTADRYTYMPDVALALLVGALFVRGLSRFRTPVLLGGLALMGALGVLSTRQVGYWADSQTLWRRVAELDPRNDVAFYNLALALQEAGDEAGAETNLQKTLELVPDHAPARSLLSSLTGLRFEREGAALAAAGRLREAVEAFGRALEQDPARMRSHASRGMALAQLGRLDEAARDLEAAVRLGDDEPEIAGALAMAQAETGRELEAQRTLERALELHPGDPHLAQSLARLRAETKKSPGR